MKRVLVLLLGAFVVVWAAALFDFSGRAAVVPAGAPQVIARAQPPSPPPAAPEPTRVVHEAAVAQEQAETPSPVAAPKAPAVPKPAAETSLVSALVRAAQGSVAVIGKTARAILTHGHPKTAAKKVRVQAPAPESTGELGEGVLSPEFEESEQRYAREPRDGDWAPAQEQRVQALLKGQPWADKVALVHCQQTVCRIVIEADAAAKDTYAQLLQVPGLSQETGLRTETPYSLRTGELSVYFRSPEAAHAP